MHTHIHAHEVVAVFAGASGGKSPETAANAKAEY